MLIYIPSSIISSIYIFVKYIVVYKKIDKHTKARREKIMIEKNIYIRTCITIDNGKRYGKNKKKKKRTIEQRINWGIHTEIMDPLILLKTTTIRDGNTTPILVREAIEWSQYSLKLMIIERDSFYCEWGRTLKKIEWRDV